MKLSNLFEVNSFDTKHNLDAWNYIWLDALLNSGNSEEKTKFFRYKEKNTSAKHLGLDFLETLSDEELKELKYDNPYIYHISINGNKLSTPGAFFLFNYDILGDPPFNIDSVGKSFEISFATKLKKIPSWFPAYAKKIIINSSGVESFEGIDKIVKSCKFIESNFNPLVRNVLGLLKISGLKMFNLDMPDDLINAHPVDGIYNNVQDMINKQLRGGRDILDCQSELIDIGLKEYAKL